MFAILFEALLIEIQEEIHHFAGWEGGGLRGTKIMNKNYVNKLAFPKFYSFSGFDLFTRMLCTDSPQTIWATSLGFCRNGQESSADNMYRAGE